MTTGEWFIIELKLFKPKFILEKMVAIVLNPTNLVNLVFSIT